MITFDEGAAGKPSMVDTRTGIVRHVELSAYMDIEVAERLQKWLAERIGELKNITKGTP